VGFSARTLIHVDYTLSDDSAILCQAVNKRDNIAGPDVSETPSQ
jgi:hypothetical protein